MCLSTRRSDRPPTPRRTREIVSRRLRCRSRDKVIKFFLFAHDVRSSNNRDSPTELLNRRLEPRRSASFYTRASAHEHIHQRSQIRDKITPDTRYDAYGPATSRDSVTNEARHALVPSTNTSTTFSVSRPELDGFRALAQPLTDYRTNSTQSPHARASSNRRIGNNCTPSHPHFLLC
uniref:Uncharacterized protein n=1 Tax=Schizaphis graminum TaxID=13262 RepID=A0A2S2PID4_SCHGA